MLIDRPQIVENSTIVNTTVASGTAFPAQPSAGELFYLTTGEVGLYSYSGTVWLLSATNAALTAHIADETKHLSAAQNTLLDGVTVTSAELNTIPALTTRVTDVETDLDGHITNQAVHLTAAQNTLLDGLSASLTAAELNHVVGVTSPIQAQLNAIVQVNNQQGTDIIDLQDAASGGAAAVQEELDTHVADQTVHLTAAQNTFLDGVTVTAAEVNFLSGVTSSVQTQLTTTAGAVAGLGTSKLSVDGTNAMAANLNAGNFRIINLAAPTAQTDAVTKEYVDNFVQGLHWVGSARAATTANITLSGLQTVDGVVLAVADRVLVKDQTTTSQNGVWLAAAGAWSRATDYNTTVEVSNSAVFVLEGTVNLKSTWVQTSTSPVIGTDPIVFTAFSGPTINTAGAGVQFISTGHVALDLYTGGGLMLTSNGTAADASNPDSKLALTNIGTAGTYRSVTVDAKGRVSAGTNPTTIAGYGLTDAVSKAGDTMTGPLAVNGRVSITNTTGTQYLLMGNQDAGGLNKPGMVVATDGSIRIGQGTSWTGNGGTFTAGLSVTNGVVTDSSGNELGWKNIPPVGAWTAGACFVTTTNQNIDTTPAGTVYSIYNNSAVSITITPISGVVLYLGGTASVGVRTLLPHGYATIWFRTTGEAVINGNVT
jgi:hypothetical protein